MAFKLTLFAAALTAIISRDSTSTRVLVLTILASTAIAQVPNNCSRTYKVVLGDTCDKISAAQNVSTFQLAHVNADTINPDCSNLVSGETICLGIEGQDCDNTHTIVSGDSCSDISVAANIDLSTLLANNPNVDSTCSNIYPDEVR
ncbi:hypothetical protein AN958_01962 [Leucoagaricus sp. SymC.cos]|nr:hypothetical protein AN958_01962 [Leucoagaricus sp. SymC.cos]